MIRVPAGTKMTPELLGELITKHKTEVTNRYQKLKDAYEIIMKYTAFGQNRAGSPTTGSRPTLQSILLIR